MICPETQRIDEMRVIFEGAPQIFFSQKLGNIARFVCNTYGDRAQTRRVLQPPLSVFFLTKYAVFVPFPGKIDFLLSFWANHSQKL